MRTQSLIRAIDGGEIPTSPHQFIIKEIPDKRALLLNAQWHSMLPKCNLRGYNDYRICYGFYYGDGCFAVAIWTRPIARHLNGLGWLELRRYAIRPESPKNTASWGLSKMAKMLKRKHPEIVKLISYQDTSMHGGTIYKASGWKAGTRCAKSSKGWNNRRNRDTMIAVGEKVRWEKDI